MIAHPIILIFSENPHQSQLASVVRQRYDAGYQIIFHDAKNEARPKMATYAEQNKAIALIIYEQVVAGLQGLDFLDRSQLYFDKARHILITIEAENEASKTAVHLIQPIYELVSPIGDPENTLYPIMDELLAEWRISEEHPYILAHGVMSHRPVRIRIEATLYRAAEIIMLTNVEDLMVIGDEGNFVGVLSVGDILRASMPDVDEIMEEGGSLQKIFQLFLRKGSELVYKPIKPLIIMEPITVDPDDHVAKVTTLLLERNIGRLPVVRNGRLLGTISRADICQAVVGARL